MYWKCLENRNCLDACSMILQKLSSIIETVKLAGPSEFFCGSSLLLLAKFGHLMLLSFPDLPPPFKKPRKPNRGFHICQPEKISYSTSDHGEAFIRLSILRDPVRLQYKLKLWSSF